MQYSILADFYLHSVLFSRLHRHFVGNKGKRANLKTGVSRKKSTPNFPKDEHFLPPDTHTYECASGGNVRFLENFKIRPFALLPTTSVMTVQFYWSPSNIYLFKVNNGYIKIMCGIRSKLTIKTPKQHHWRGSGVLVVNVGQVNADWENTWDV